MAFNIVDSDNQSLHQALYQALYQPRHQSLSKKLLRPLMLLGLTLISGSQIAIANDQTDPALAPYHLTYAASYNGMDINAERHLKQEGQHYVLTTTAKNMLSTIQEEGSFKVNKDGTIIDQRYQYDRSILGIKKTEKLKYDREAGVAKYKSKKKKRQVKLKSGLLNRLSYQVQLQRDLLNQVTPLQYQVISRGRVKEYNFEIMGEELLETPMGELKTVKVRRVRKDDDRETLLWFSPQWNYLLVQLWQREKGGDDYKITIEKGNLNQQPLALSSATP